MRDHPRFAAIDQQVSNVFSSIESLQVNAVKRYFQLLKSSDVAHDGNAPVNVDKSRKPGSKNGASWAQVAGVPSGLLAQIETHEYLGPLGIGFFMIARVRFGVNWIRTRHSGPEIYRDTDDEWRTEGEV
jgi:hypothetical protein